MSFFLGSSSWGGSAAGASSRHSQGYGNKSLNLENKIKTLIVDDNGVNRKIHKALLKNLEVECTEAKNGREAVDLCAGGAMFDLILIDMEMPVMDGPRATRLMRSMGINCKIVGVSGNSRASEQQEFLDAGVDEFHVKPLTRAKLISLIEEIRARG